MTYTYELILKKFWKNHYALYSPKGHKVFDIMANNYTEAYDKALRFMSSWTSVKITVENDDESQNLGN